MNITLLFSLILLSSCINTAYINCSATINMENIENLNGLLSLAIERGNISEVKKLINAGAYINNIEKTQMKRSPLLSAAYHDRTEIVELLLKEGADFDLVDSDGSTALMYAAMHNDVNMVELLVKAGADIDTRNNANETASTLVGKDPTNDTTLCDESSIRRYLLLNSIMRQIIIDLRRKISNNLLLINLPKELADMVSDYAQERYSDILKEDYKKYIETKTNL